MAKGRRDRRADKRPYRKQNSPGQGTLIGDIKSEVGEAGGYLSSHCESKRRSRQEHHSCQFGSMLGRTGEESAFGGCGSARNASSGVGVEKTEVRNVCTMC